MRMQRRRKKGQGESASAPPLQAQFQSRPFQDANTLTNKQAAPPEMQLQPEQRGFDFASIPLFASSATSSQPIQRQEDPNLQMKPEVDAIQRMGEDDEMQMKPEVDAIQRMGEDDEMQMKPESNGSINPLLKNLVQRDHLETPEPRIPIQAKLTVGAPGDKYEQEADQVAQNVVEQINAPEPNSTQSNPSVQREMTEGDQVQMKPIIQRQELDGGVEASRELESSINQAKGGGQSLDAGLQRSMGQAMGADFSGVKVHTDSQANTLSQSLQAKAFTTGDHVFFKKGEYQPGNERGQELIAHELTHVQQQNGSQVQRAIDQSLIDEFSRVLEIQNPRVIEVPDKTINNDTTLYDTRFSEYGNDNLLNVDDLKSESLASVNLPDVIESYRQNNDPYLSQPVVDILDYPGGAAYLHTKHVAVYNRGLINAKKDGNLNRTILHEMGHGKQDSQGANFGTSHRIILEYHNVLLNENLYSNTSVGQQENAPVRMEYMKTKSKIISSGKTWSDLLENATAEANPKRFQNEKLLLDIACIVGTDDRLEQGADKVIENLIDEYFDAVSKGET